MVTSGAIGVGRQKLRYQRLMNSRLLLVFTDSLYALYFSRLGYYLFLVIDCNVEELHFVPLFYSLC